MITEQIATMRGPDVYLNQLGQIPLLSTDDELMVGRQMRAGIAATQSLVLTVAYSPGELAALVLARDEGLVARERLIACNLRLVVKEAKRYRQRNVDLEDLIQFGNMGLITAADKYDPDRGNKFSTMAVWWIRQAITREIANTARSVRLPVHMVEAVQKVYGFVANCGGRQPSVADIALALEMPEKTVRTALANMHLPASLDARIDDEGDATLGAFVPADSDTEAEASAVLMRDEVRQVVGWLRDERKRAIIVLRFGLDGNEPQTLEAIGQRLNLTRERVRQLEAEALQTLRHPAYGGMLRGWLR